MMDELAFCYERTEMGIGRAVQNMENAIYPVSDNVDVVMRDVTNLTDRTQTLEADITYL